MEKISLLGASFVVAGLIYFIFHNALKTANFKRRALFFLIFGLVLVLGVGFGIYNDYKAGLVKKLTINYFAFPLTILLFAFIFPLVNFLKAKRFNHHIRGFKSQVDNSRTEYLYILYKYKDHYLLELDNEYKGITIKFDKKVYFHDEMIKEFLSKEEMEVLKHRFCGTISTTQKKKKSIYYCYEIEIKSLNNELRKYEAISK